MTTLALATNVLLGHTRVSSGSDWQHRPVRLTEKDRKTFEGQRWRTLGTREETRFIRYKPVIVGFRTTSYAFSDTWAAVARAFLTVFYDSNRSIERSALPPQRAIALPFTPLGSARAARRSLHGRYDFKFTSPFFLFFCSSFFLYFIFALIFIFCLR